MLQPYKSTRSIVYTENLASKSNLKIDVKKKESATWSVHQTLGLINLKNAEKEMNLHKIKHIPCKRCSGQTATTAGASNLDLC